ncbi:hypothetical protein [Actinomadura rupiterrae]|uniref:hypothetical protein n=1 Tax=Actinomadura rupiterrae TaxID=559627 RepID=UPI0020A39017|nr:hypothetical protein [Actinomadura rupiterrae]MCP2336266.1 hypothetical protein [Actinomadura rupiterrae]
MRIRRAPLGRRVRADVEDFHLGRLAWVLAERGWMSSSRAWERPRVLRVFHPLVSGVGESVQVRRRGGWLCFIDSSGNTLGRVRRLGPVVDGIDMRLEPCRLAAQMPARVAR